MRSRHMNLKGVLCRSVALAALLVVSSGSVAEAWINVWTTNGPENQQVLSLAIAPMTPTTLYAGTNGRGVFKSTNLGLSWGALCEWPPPPGAICPGLGV